MTDNDESEIDKIYKKHHDLNQYLEFDKICSEQLEHLRGEEEPQIFKIADEHRTAAKENEARGQYVVACAHYLSAAIALGNYYKMDKVKFEEYIDSIKNATRIAVRHDSHLQNKTLQILESTNFSRFSLQDGLMYKEQALMAALHIAETLNNTKEILSCTNKLAEVKTSRKEYDEAITLYKKCIQLALLTANYDPSQTKQYMAQLQLIYDRQGNKEGSEQLLKEQIALSEKNSPVISEASIKEILHLQDLYLQNKQMEKATESLQKALTLLEYKLSKLKDSSDPFQPSEMHIFSSNLNTLASSLSKMESAGIQNDDLHEQILRLQYAAQKQTPKIPFINNVTSALTSFLLKKGKAAAAIEILRSEIGFGNDIQVLVRSPYMSSYLAALKAANMKDEYDKFVAEIQQMQQKQIDEQMHAVEASMKSARHNLINSPSQYFIIALHVLGYNLSQGRDKVEAEKLSREIMKDYYLVPRGKLNGEALSAIWHFSRLSGAGSSTNDKLCTNLLEDFEKWRVGQENINFTGDLTDQIHQLISPNDSIAFANLIVQLRKKYNPNNVELLQQAYDWLCDAYAQSEKEQEEREAREQLIEVLKKKNNDNEITTAAIIKQQILICASDMADKPDEVLGKLEKFLLEMTKLSSNSQCELINVLANNFCSLARVYLKQEKINKAQTALKFSLDASRLINTEFRIADQKHIFDSINSVLLARSNFKEAELNLEQKISALAAVSKFDDSFLIEQGDSRARLSEILLLHSMSVQESLEAKTLAESSEEQLQAALDVYRNCNSPFSLWSCGWAKRRHDYVLKNGKDPDDFHAYEPLNLAVRHHLEDVPNQYQNIPQQPLESAIVTRSFLEVGANCATSVFNSNKNIEVEQHGAEVSSTGTTILNGRAKITSTVRARNIVLTGSSITVMGRLDASGDIPEPFPWQPALTPSGSLTVVPTRVNNGSIAAAPSGSIANLNDLQLNQNEKVKIEPGDYLISSLHMSQGASLQISTPGDVKLASAANSVTSRIVRFFVKENPTLAIAQIQIDGASLNTSGTSLQLQFWCQSDGLFLVRGKSTARALVYAPNGLVIVSDSKLIGALAADEVRLKNGASVSYDSVLPSPQRLGLVRLEVPPMTDINYPKDNKACSLTNANTSPDEDYAANFCISAGDYAEAIKCFSKAILQNPTMQNYIGRANCYLRIGHYDEALKDCLCVIECEPNFALAHATCGQVYEKLGQVQQARKEFHKALEILPLDEDYLNLVFFAVCQKGLGNTAAAIEILNEAAAITKENAEIYRVRAEIFEALGKNDLAKKDRELVESLYNKMRQKNESKTQLLRSS